MDSYRQKDIISLLKSESGSRSKALEFLYKENFLKAKVFITKNGGNVEDAEDTFQESMVALYQMIMNGKFREEASINTLLFSIVKNQWLLKLRKRINTEDISSFDNLKIEHTNYDFAEFSKEKIIRDLIGMLSLDCQKIITLFYYQKYSLEEIGHEFQMSNIQSIKTKKYRCMQNLIKFFKLSGINADLM